MRERYFEEERREVERENMECPYCGSDKVKEKDNFCGHCGKKLKTDCNCWIKKGSYNCGEDSCPGYELLVKEVKM